MPIVANVGKAVFSHFIEGLPIRNIGELAKVPKLIKPDKVCELTFRQYTEWFQPTVAGLLVQDWVPLENDRRSDLQGLTCSRQCTAIKSIDVYFNDVHFGLAYGVLKQFVERGRLNFSGSLGACCSLMSANEGLHGPFIGRQKRVEQRAVVSARQIMRQVIEKFLVSVHGEVML